MCACVWADPVSQTLMWVNISFDFPCVFTLSILFTFYASHQSQFPHFIPLSSLRYTRVREWIAEGSSAHDVSVKARRWAISMMKQEAHRCVRVRCVACACVCIVLRVRV